MNNNNNNYNTIKKMSQQISDLRINKYNSSAERINSRENNLYHLGKKNISHEDMITSKHKSQALSPIEEKIEQISKELKLYKRKNSEIENNKLIYQTENDIFIIENMLKNHNIHLKKKNQITFLDIICFILKKINKRFIENEILKLFFLRIEKLVAMFKTLNIGLNDMMGKLVEHIKYEKKLKDNILFKEGDKGDKFYIILKGDVGILIQKESIINCTPIEFFKYLIVIYLYQEKSLSNKMIFLNRENLKFDDRCFLTLMDIFKFYHFYKEYSTTKRPYKDIIEFVRTEKKICNYLHIKNDYPPEETFHSLDLSNILAEELYNYYCRIIDNIQKVFLTGIGSINKKRDSATNKIVNPTNLAEFGLYVNLHDQDESAIKSKDFFEKIFHFNEISINSIYSCNVNDYIQRLDCECILKSIRDDSKNFFVKMYEGKMNFKYYSYLEVNHLKDGNIFGELALINPSKKRTATVIIKEDCHLGVLNKEAYDISIKNAQDKERIRNLLFFTNGPIFNGIANNFFLNNYFFRFKKRVYTSGEVIFNRGEIRSKVVFIINGELQLSGKMTLKKLSEIIKYLNEGRRLDDGGFSKKYCKESLEFKRIYEDDKKKFRFYVLKDKEIAGLDDMTENNVYLFDCICTSLEPTEVYELDFNIFEDASKDFSVKNNNDEYVSRKKEIISNRLYRQRDSIAKNEFNRIKAYSLNLNIEYLYTNDDKNNVKENDVKTLNNFFHLNNITYNTKILSFLEESQSSKFNVNTSIMNSNFNNISNYFYKKFPLLNSSRNLSAYSKANKSNQNQNSKVSKDNEENIRFFTKNNSNKNPNLEQMQKEKSFILLKVNYFNNEEKENITNLIKNNKSENLSRIGAYINNNKKKTNYFSIPKNNKKIIFPAPHKIIHQKIKKLNNNITPSSKILIKEFTKKYIEPIKIPNHKRRFIFNNQEIFEPLLNDKFMKEKKNINMEIKNDKNSLIKDDDNKDKKIKDKNNKNINKEGKKYEPSNRKRRNKDILVKKKIINKNIEENYQNIFLIDCLCLDKWEEQKNKNIGIEKGKFRGKKLKVI